MDNTRLRDPVIVVIVLIAIVGVIFMWRSHPSKSLYYGVTIFNDGTDVVEMEPFDLYDGPHATVDVGEVYPQSDKSVAPFFEVPRENHSIRWKNKMTGKKAGAAIKIQLPAEFLKKGSEIEIHINPKENRAHVTYSLDQSISSHR